jgi:nickel-dependent lactate racemase
MQDDDSGRVRVLMPVDALNVKGKLTLVDTLGREKPRRIVARFFKFFDTFEEMVSEAQEMDAELVCTYDPTTEQKSQQKSR